MKPLTTFLLLFSLFSLSAQDTLRLKTEMKIGQPGFTGLSNKRQFEQLKAKYGMDWYHSWQMTKEGVIADYAVENYPSMFLIDPKGKIVGYNLSTKEIKEIVIQSK